MRKQLLPFVAVGVVIAGLMVAFTLFVQRGAHLELKGSILKVRTLSVEEASTIAVLDFRFVNPSDYLFIVRTVAVSMEDRQERVFEGAVVSDVDVQRLFQYYPLLGQRYNETLLMKTRIAPHQSMDRMLAVRFEVSEKQFQERERLTIRVEDVDGAVSEIREGGGAVGVRSQNLRNLGVLCAKLRYCGAEDTAQSARLHWQSESQPG